VNESQSDESRGERLVSSKQLPGVGNRLRRFKGCNAAGAAGHDAEPADGLRCIADAANAAPGIRTDLVSASWLREWDLAIREREVIATLSVPS
jgi:hypothetical protein